MRFGGNQKEGLRGAVRGGIVIGTILILMNDGLPVPSWMRMDLTVCVPFCVSLQGRLMARKHAKQKRGRITPTSDPSRTQSTMPAPYREARIRVLQRLATVVDRPPLLEAS